MTKANVVWTPLTSPRGSTGIHEHVLFQALKQVADTQSTSILQLLPIRVGKAETAFRNDLVHFVRDAIFVGDEGIAL